MSVILLKFINFQIKINFIIILKFLISAPFGTQLAKKYKMIGVRILCANAHHRAFLFLLKFDLIQ